MRKTFQILFVLISFSFLTPSVHAQHTVAREWNEALLESIRGDFARPTVHARNLWHSSAMMYDIWAVFDEKASPYFLGNEINGYTFEFDGFDTTGMAEAKINEAISHAMFNLISHRFEDSPQGDNTLMRIRDLMDELGFDYSFTDTDYSTGNPAAFGNFMAQSVIDYGLQDGSREQTGFDNDYYTPSNTPLVIQNPGNPILENPNNWQQLTLDIFIDQSGNEVPFNTPDFLSPEWGNVDPFSLTDDDLTTYVKDGTDEYKVYLDPGAPPYIDFNDAEASFEYIRGFELVLKWSSQLDPADGKMVDISPASNGNNPPLPEDAGDILSYYDYENGGDLSQGHELNPVTGFPYVPQMVPFGDYTRVLAEFWADGPDSETPPGHWFSILNYVNDHPLNNKQYEGIGEVYSDLEWDIKTYFMLGGAMHDAAIAAWGVKGYYDYIRPVSAIRYLASLGQRSDPNLPNYSPFGFELVEGFVELVDEDDPLVGENMEHLNKLKTFVWRGPDFIDDPETDKAGLGWILIENWWPYQRPSFVTPPFAGYVSGHSTYSRAAAEILTKFTGDAYFPGGMGIFIIEENEFLVFEEGPSQSFALQWATYRDASDETSLSRIWGGIHPPADDIPGRIMGIKIADRVFEKAESFFFRDDDQDGFFSYEDCDDQNPDVNPDAIEECNGLDNDCNGEIDDGLPLFTYYADVDDDGYGNPTDSIVVCNMQAPDGYSELAQDCNDTDPAINPDSPEICDDIDNDCNGDIDEALPLFTYYTDLDDDGYGNPTDSIVVCESEAPIGYSAVSQDCNDNDPAINPDSPEICDDIDNDCNGDIDNGLPLFTYYTDADDDGYGNPTDSIVVCESEAPLGYSAIALDCNDNDAAINPESPEVCDDIDNDCNGDIDDGLPLFTYYVDVDDDGYGNPNDSILICKDEVPMGYSTIAEDCNDNDAAINPDSPEVCDDIDNDCNGDIDDGLPLFTYYVDVDDDGYGNPNDSILICEDEVPMGYSTISKDCNDNDAAINPDSPEICDDIDNDCNGEIDDELPLFTYYLDMDADGFGNPNDSILICENEAPEGYSTIAQDCNDNDATINPDSPEICDHIDNDCNSEIDDNIPYFSYYRDQDNDDFGDINMELFICESEAPMGYVVDHTDCDDNNANIYPGAPEISDNDIDEDCNGIDLFEITKIFPVPFSDALTVHLDQQAPVRFVLINNLGELVHDQIAIGQNNVFVINNITAGSNGVLNLYIFDQSNELIHSQRVLRM